jgi:PST family polysaccharide transporter
MCISSFLSNNYTQNTLWLFGGQTIRMGVGLVAAALVARYLGPEQYGMYNYVLSAVLLLQIFGNLGLTGVLQKRCIEEPSTVEDVLGTSFVLNVISGSFLYFLVVLFVHFSSAPPPEQELFLIFGTLLILDSFRCIDIWFHARTRSKLSVYANTLPVLLSAAAKLTGIAFGADLTVFASIFVLETACIGFLLAWLYAHNDHPLNQWRASLDMAKSLLRQSWPLILNGFAINLYLRMDQIMLKAVHSAADVGEYAAASRLSSLWYVLPILLSSSLAPAILKAREHSGEAYKKRLQAFMDLNTGVALLIAIPFSLLAPWLIRLLFGEAFASSSAILSIHVWSCVFVFQAVARNVDIVGEGRFRFSLLSSLVGATVNLGLNAWLIPQYAGIGAAIATLISQLSCSFLLTAFYKPLRHVFVMQCKSLLLPIRLPKLISELKSKESNT